MKNFSKIAVVVLVVSCGVLLSFYFWNDSKSKNIEDLPKNKDSRIVDEYKNSPTSVVNTTPLKKIEIKKKEGRTISQRFMLPDGYERIKVESGSYGEYLRNFKLKEDGVPVKLFDGREKGADVHEAVLDIDVGNRDLQQCADAAMRLWADYNYYKGDFNKIHFNFGDGFKADYSKWRAGNLIRVSGDRASWERTTINNTTYESYRKYLNIVFAYAGTLSLSGELKKVPTEDIQIGDIFLKGASPGHCVIVMDIAINKSNGKKIFMVAQSYMPAQDIHVLKNGEDSDLSPWYNLDFGDTLQTPQWTFKREQLYRFG